MIDNLFLNSYNISKINNLLNSEKNFTLLPFLEGFIYINSKFTQNEIFISKYKTTVLTFLPASIYDIFQLEEEKYFLFTTYKNNVSFIKYKFQLLDKFDFLFIIPQEVWQRQFFQWKATRREYLNKMSLIGVKPTKYAKNNIIYKYISTFDIIITFDRTKIKYLPFLDKKTILITYEYDNFQKTLENILQKLQQFHNKKLLFITEGNFEIYDFIYFGLSHKFNILIEKKFIVNPLITFSFEKINNLLNFNFTEKGFILHSSHSDRLGFSNQTFRENLDNLIKVNLPICILELFAGNSKEVGTYFDKIKGKYIFLHNMFSNDEKIKIFSKEEDISISYYLSQFKTNFISMIYIPPQLNF